MFRRWMWMVAGVPLVLLTGCPQQGTGSPGKIPAQATAPTVTAPTDAARSAATTAPPTTAQVAATAAKAAREQQLIEQVDSIYASGVANYQAGRLDAARMDFDLAVDTMLRSGMDLKSESQLSEKFEHLLDQVNALEMDALKQGNGLSQSVDDAPLSAADEVTFPANPELKAKLTAELQTTKSDFPLVVNDYVAGFISYFSNSKTGHAHLVRSLERAGKYKEMIAKSLKDEGVPQDLIYLAVAESGFQPQVVNAQSGAGGMWQFMPFRGAYGLERNGWFDERFDPEKSSVAYARYMKELYNQFGDWYLAMAAYNWGPGNVQRAVMRTGYADFWELYKRNALPTATKNYVPGIIAAIIMSKNPEQYGLDKLVPDPPVVSDTVTVEYAVDLRLVADVTDAPLESIIALNPSLLRMRTPPDIPFDLHLPVGTKDVYLSRIASIPEEKRASWRFHTVKPGETLDGIALSFHARASDIAATNGISVGDSVDTGDELVIPVATVAASASGARSLHYTTRRGDTLVTVADRYSVSVEDLRRWNHLSTASALTPGRKLIVSEPVHLAPSTHAKSRTKHGHASPVTKGDSHHAASSPQQSGKAKAGTASAKKLTRSAATSGAKTTASASATTKTKKKKAA